MSDAFLVRRGGSGGLSPNSAVIHVTAPVGSSISFAKGGVVAKVLGPDKSHVNVEDTSYASWYYSVSPSNFGTWTVTATIGPDTASDTVLISSNKEYEIVLSLTLLYYYGNTMDAVTGGYQAKAQRGTDSGYAAKTPTLNYYSDNMYISFPSDGAGIVRTNNAIDVTKFTTLCALVDLTGTKPTNGNYYFGLLSTITTTYWYTYLTPSLFLGSQTPGSGVEIRVDITSVTASRYIAFAQSANTNGRITVHKMWLE